jgi:protein O-mannosyl-transferase
VSSQFVRREWIPLSLLVAAVLAIYVPSLGNAPIFDDQYLVDGQLLRDYSSPELRVRAVSYGSFVWLDALFGEGWWKHRMVNLSVHLGTILALTAFYRQVLRHIEPTPSSEPHAPLPAPLHESRALWLAIGLFALNPAAVYAVAYLIQRSILLATFFVVLGLWLFALGLHKGRWQFHAAALLCYVLAVLSKEHAILVPLAAIPLYIVLARPAKRRIAALGASGIVLVALMAVFMYFRYGEVLGKPFDEYSHVYLEQLARLEPSAVKNAWLLSILNQAYLFFHYALAWLFPASGWMSINLRPVFPLTWTTFPHILGVVGYLAVLAGGFFLLIRYRDWRSLLGLSMLIPALLFATEFATVWVQDPFVLYRSYLWAIGVPGIAFLLVHGPPPRVLAVIGLVVGILLIWQAQDRVFSMASEEKAWTDAIKKLPNDPRSVGRWFPYLNRGSAYAANDQLGLAMKDFEASAALGDLGMGAMNLGSILSAKGKHKEALAAFDEAERQGYKLYNLHFQRGLALMALRRNDEALAQFGRTLDANPPSPTLNITLLQVGRLAVQMGHYGSATAALDRLVYIEPSHKEGRYLLGMSLVMEKDYERARKVLDRLIADDRNPRAFYARALANYGLKRKTEALADIEEAMKLGMDNPHMREWKARIQAMP